MPATRSRGGEILLVDDSAKDVRLIREVLHEQGHPHRLKVARTGEDALRLLRGDDATSEPLQPDLILLDINLPSLSGIEVLQHIKQDTALRHLPVLMLSTSTAERDVSQAYQRYANGYLVKPPSYDDFVALIGHTLKFWLDYAQPAPRWSAL